VVQLGHDSFVMCLAFAPDGKFIVTGSQDGTARLWDAATQREIRRFGSGALVQGVAWTPDGQSIATASLDGAVRLWGRDSGRQIRVLTAERAEMTSVAVSPDGKLIAAGNGDAAQLWDLATGRRIRRITLPPRVNSVAFSSDGRHLLLASGAEYDPSKVPAGVKLKPLPSVVALFEVETGREVWRFQGHLSPVKDAALSADGKLVLTGSGGFQGGDNTARLLDAATGRELRALRHDAPVVSVSLSADGQKALTISVDATGRVWNTANGQLQTTINRAGDSLYSGAFSADGRLLALGGARDVGLHTPTGEAQGSLAGYAFDTGFAAFSPDGRFIATANSYKEQRRDFVETGGAVGLWDTLTGREEQRLNIKNFGADVLAYSSDGRFLVSGQGFSATLWDVAEGREVRRFDAPNPTDSIFSSLTAAALSRDNKLLLLGFGSVTEQGKGGNYVGLWDTATGQMLRRVALDAAVNSVAIAPDGTIWLVGGGGYVFRDGALVEQAQAVALLDAQTGQEIRRIAGNRGVFAPDGKQILTNGKDGTALLFDAATGRQLREYPSKSQADVETLAFARDGQRFITGDEKGAARVWDTANGQVVSEFAARAGAVKSVGLTPDGKSALTLHGDNAVRLWNLSGGRELCRLLSFRDGSWVVADATGRFDASDLSDLRGLHWLLPDNPVTPLPLEIFQRQYYEPRLLPRLLAGEKLPPLPSLTALNRAQPVVKIVNIEAAQEAGRVNVTVEIANATATQRRGAETVNLDSGVFDVRLFRDGQMAGYSTTDAALSKYLAAAPDDAAAWRAAHAVKLDAGGKATLTFRNVKLPPTGLKETEFSAYAFNQDRVKSATARQVYTLPDTPTPVKGRAYVIAVGVNAYENKGITPLRYTVNDATKLLASLAPNLSGRYEEVVSVPLLADYELALPGGRVVVAPDATKEDLRQGRLRPTLRTATKANVKAVLDVLAGRAPDAAALTEIPNGEKLRAARPEDLVVIAFSSHGYVDQTGVFYLLPADTGTDKVLSPAFLRRCVSSDELSLWLRDVDAGEMAMIVAACHSAAAVEGTEFKPGPMGSRGLGQLAYDKGMRILTATQADNVARESGAIRQDLLMYALTQDGLAAWRADYKPTDGAIMLSEWLGYGREQMPKLYEDIRAGRVANVALSKPSDGGKGVEEQGEATIVREQLQQPALFDFAARRKRDTMLAQRKQ
jgi:WD40 repeat protein